MRLPRVRSAKNHQLKRHFISLCALYDVASLDERDVEIEAFDSWPFVKVSLFRWCEAGPGCGTSEWRERLWVEQRKAISDSFDMCMPPSASWRHVGVYTPSYDPTKPYDFIENARGTIPGVTFCILKEDER